MGKIIFKNLQEMSPQQQIDYLVKCHNDMEFQADNLMNRRNIRDIEMRIDNLIIDNPDLQRPELKKY